MSEHHFEGRKDENFEVGYCKPPQQHQFQKGNKLGKGRKAGSKNIRTVIEEEAFSLIPYTDQSGVTKRAPAIQLAVRQQVKSALQGDLKAAEFISKQVNVHCPPPVQGRLPRAALHTLALHLPLTFAIFR